VRFDVAAERLVVVSDLHIGNPFSDAGQRLQPFLEHLRREGFDLVINGDGFEMLQASFKALARDSLSLLDDLRAFTASGRRVFYVIGNHDITLEHLLHSALASNVVPFLNVTSGAARIRVEHGHTYDPSFMKHPLLYQWLTRAAGPFLHLYPDVYRLWSRYQGLKDRWWRKRARAGLDASVYYEAADRLLARGFDAVVFGHTHKAERVPLGDDGVYYNSGNWMRGASFVRVASGVVTLEAWTPQGPRLVAAAAP
jgi:UDP-2,3-diacylglucosamine pyrophosphatase LpxH